MYSPRKDSASKALRPVTRRSCSAAIIRCPAARGRANRRDSTHEGAYDHGSLLQLAGLYGALPHYTHLRRGGHRDPDRRRRLHGRHRRDRRPLGGGASVRRACDPPGERRPRRRGHDRHTKRLRRLLQGRGQRRLGGRGRVCPGARPAAYIRPGGRGRRSSRHKLHLRQDGAGPKA